MAVNYPGSLDSFNEPSLPEYTSLSSAGDGTRAHVEHHHDLGQAVVALETYAAQRTHDHSGDATDTTKGAKLVQANTHESVDTDVAAASIHHTLGTGQYQAAPGNHNHDYNTLLNVPWKICTAATRPADPQLGMMIYETDTNRVRVWAAFAENAVVSGIDGRDDFNRVNAVDLGADWNLTYSLNPGVNGYLATPGGTTASWTDGGASTHRVLARRTKLADRYTQTDDQILTWKTGSTVIEGELPFTEGALNDGYLRLSADRASYIRIRVGYDYFKVFYTVAGWEAETHLGTLEGIDTNIANCEWRATVEGRTITLYRNGTRLGEIIDTRQVTAKGANNRGWGFGMEAGARGFGQTTPANIDWIRIQDLPYYNSISRWSLLPMGALPACRLKQTVAQKLTNTGTILQWGQVQEDGFGFFDPSNPTAITVTEPGLYHIAAAIQWDDQIVPDVASAVLMLNGQETTIRESRFLRGDGFAPGFSQTLSVVGSLRIAAGDVLAVKAYFTASGGILNNIFSWFDPASKVLSRIDITYTSP